MKRLRNNERGFTATELLTVVTIVTAVSAGAFIKVKEKALEIKCKSNLHQIALALRMKEMIEGKLPNAAFFPKDSKDPRGIHNLLPDCKELFICPSAPQEWKKYGTTFLWNDECSGKPLDAIKKPEQTWLMISIGVVSEKVPPPHPEGYNVLYADLKVRTKKKPPTKLMKEIKTKLEKVKKRIEKDKGNKDKGNTDGNRNEGGGNTDKKK